MLFQRLFSRKEKGRVVETQKTQTEKNPVSTRNQSNTSASVLRPTKTNPSPVLTVDDKVLARVLVALETKNVLEIERLIKGNKKLPYCKLETGRKRVFFLSQALLKQLPLQGVEAIFRANPSALTNPDDNGMTALHHACMVPTKIDVIKFLVSELKRLGYDIGQLAAKDGWSVIHTACSVGMLPQNSFLYILKHSMKVLSKTTHEKKSTPLHLAINGFKRRSPQEREVILQEILKAYPFSITALNSDNLTPVDIAEYEAKRGKINSDTVELLWQVQNIVTRTYNSRVQIEQRLAICQTMLSISDSDDDSSSAVMSNELSNFESNMSETLKFAIRQNTLAHIERPLLLLLRNKFKTEQELRDLISSKRKEFAMKLSKPELYSECEELRQQVEVLDEQLKRELEAKVPFEIQITRKALRERLQSDIHMLPMNDVSLQYLKVCTNHFSVENRIGKGGFGEVFHAYDTQEGVRYAVKTTATEIVNDPSLRREVEILSRVFHPNIIRLFGFYIPPGARSPQYLVFEYAAGGSMRDVLSCEAGRKALDWSKRLSAAVGVASALNYLHNGLQQSIAHHDIKPENIVFTETLDRAILIDCGISKVLKKNAVDFTKTKGGTPFYLPDDYTEDTPYDEKCEVFSFGLVKRILLIGKMPKNLADRVDLLKEGSLEPDPLGGSWPPNVLAAFLQLTTQCIRKYPIDRPPIKSAYEDLMNMNEVAEKSVKLTALQMETINNSLNESRMLSRVSRQLDAMGFCYCSPNQEKRGLHCPGKLHFQCSECFNNYVLDYLGEEIYCLDASCNCTEPYTLEELHRHVKQSIFCRHVEMHLKNRELANLRNHEVMMKEMGSGFNRLMTSVSAVYKDELKCPLLALLVPFHSSGKSSLVRRGLREWAERKTKKTFNMYFLCAHDYSCIDTPILVEAEQEWVRIVTPLLRAAILGLSDAVHAGVANIRIPTVNHALGQKEILDCLSILDEILVDATEHNELEVKSFYNRMQDGTIFSSESYQFLSTLANHPKNTGWKREMLQAERQGELAWVKKDNEEQWKKGYRN